MSSRITRYHAIDVARALAVIGVVYNHSVDGLLASGLLDPGGVAAQLNGALYIFRMPALALLLGLFVPKGVARRGASGYFRERATFAVWLYLLWFFLQTGVEIATSGMKNNATAPVALLEVWSMPAHLWFLPYLAVSACVMTIMRPWLIRRRAFMVLAFLTVASAAVWDWNPSIFGLRGLSLLLFTAVGATVGISRLGQMLSAPIWRWCVVGSVSLSGFVILHWAGMSPGTTGSVELPVSTVLVSMVGAFLGVLILLTLAAAASRFSPIRRFLGYVGRHTLEVYLAHVIAVAGTRIFMQRAGVESDEVFLPAVLAVGVLAPLALAYVAPRIRCGWLFAPPTPLNRWSKSANLDRSAPVKFI